jgi:hypothetical protein
MAKTGFLILETIYSDPILDIFIKAFRIAVWGIRLFFRLLTTSGWHRKRRYRFWSSQIIPLWKNFPYCFKWLKVTRRNCYQTPHRCRCYLPILKFLNKASLKT